MPYPTVRNYLPKYTNRGYRTDQYGRVGVEWYESLLGSKTAREKKICFSRTNENIFRRNEKFSCNNEKFSRTNEKNSRSNEKNSRRNEKLSRTNENIS